MPNPSPKTGIDPRKPTIARDPTSKGKKWAFADLSTNATRSTPTVSAPVRLETTQLGLSGRISGLAHRYNGIYLEETSTANGLITACNCGDLNTTALERLNCMSKCPECQIECREQARETRNHATRAVW
jgi:hypothetical protein